MCCQERDLDAFAVLVNLNHSTGKLCYAKPLQMGCEYEFTPINTIDSKIRLQQPLPVLPSIQAAHAMNRQVGCIHGSINILTF